MPHFSEGELHAWLDGVIPEDSGELRSLRRHLDSCPDCTSRLEDARRLRGDASSILTSALPGGAAPSFEDIRRRALVEAGSPGLPETHSSRLRTGWLSVQRLGWAASIMLALGAGWIGRAVLVEKGWTDPFNEGPAAALGPAVESESAEETPADYFALESDAAERLGEEVNKEVARMDRPEEANEAFRKQDVEAKAPLKVEGAASEGQTERGERALQVPEVELEDAAETRPDREGALGQAEGRATDEPDMADVSNAPADPRQRENLEPTSIQPPLDPWHDLPAERFAPPTPTSLGCYRLEYSWSPGLAYLPGTIELLEAEAKDWAVSRVYSVGLPGRVEGQFRQAIWASPGPDSVWVQLVTGRERDMFTVRAEREGRDWEGEGRVLSPAAPVSTGQTRGTVRLLQIRCELN